MYGAPYHFPIQRRLEHHHLCLTQTSLQIVNSPQSALDGVSKKNQNQITVLDMVATRMWDVTVLLLLLLAHMCNTCDSRAWHRCGTRTGSTLQNLLEEAMANADGEILFRPLLVLIVASSYTTIAVKEARSRFGNVGGCCVLLCELWLHFLLRVLLMWMWMLCCRMHLCPPPLKQQNK